MLTCTALCSSCLASLAAELKNKKAGLLDKIGRVDRELEKSHLPQVSTCSVNEPLHAYLVPVLQLANGGCYPGH